LRKGSVTWACPAATEADAADGNTKFMLVLDHGDRQVSRRELMDVTVCCQYFLEQCHHQMHSRALEKTRVLAAREYSGAIPRTVFGRIFMPACGYCS
jgi:hypothetical protein